jgi:hypothetical protein
VPRFRCDDLLRKTEGPLLDELAEYDKNVRHYEIDNNDVAVSAGAARDVSPAALRRISRARNT